MLHRRAFLTGLIAAPAIVAVNNIMPIKVIKPVTIWDYDRIVGLQVQINKMIEDITNPPVIWYPETNTLVSVPAWPKVKMLNMLIRERDRLINA